MPFEYNALLKCRLVSSFSLRFGHRPGRFRCVRTSRELFPGGQGGVMKRRFWTSSEFIPISVRFCPPLAKGGQGAHGEGF